MSSTRIYYDDAFAREFTAEVLSCESAAVGPKNLTASDAAARTASEVWHVKLDRTAFYPTSGGQPHDTGELGNAKVLDVLEKDDEVVHLVDWKLAPGKVTGRIDWDRRFDHMQQHSGQHLLSAVLHKGYGLPTVSFHLGAQLCTIDVRGREPTQEILDGAAVAANEIAFEDRAIRVKYGTAKELAAAGVRKEVEREGLLRAIGIEAVELQPCGGTHVQSTGQIGTISLRGVSKIRQDWRIEFACGRRAERLAREDLARIKSVAERLNCAIPEVISAAERLVGERDAHFKSARASNEKLAAVEARVVLQETETGEDGLRVVRGVLEGVQSEYVQSFAREIAKAENAIALLVRLECGQVFFSQNAGAGKDMNELLAEALKRVGGKGGGTRDSARGRLSDPTHAQELLAEALTLLRPGGKAQEKLGSPRQGIAPGKKRPDA